MYNLLVLGINSINLAVSASLSLLVISLNREEWVSIIKEDKAELKGP
jgi:hypothetical protein